MKTKTKMKKTNLELNERKKNKMENLENKENLEMNQEQQEQQQEEQKIEMDIDQLKQWVVTEEGKKFMQPLLDRHFTKGLETWKTNNLEKLVNEKYEQLYPSDPQAKRIKELELELKQKEVKDATIKLLEENKIPVAFSDYFISDNPETTSQTIKNFVEMFNKSVNIEVDKRLRQGSFAPKSFRQQHKTLTKEEIAGLPYEQRVQLWQQDPSIFR